MDTFFRYLVQVVAHLNQTVKTKTLV